MLLFLLQIQPLELYADEKIRLEIKEVSSTEKQLSITYVMTNLSDSDIWVCNSDSDEKKIDEELDTGVVKIVNKAKRSLLIGVESINTYELLIDGPVGALYSLLKSKESREFKIMLKYPVIDNYAWDVMLVKDKGKKKGESVTQKDINELILRVGYYLENLNESQKCCYQMRPEQEKPGIKKVSYKWARKYKEKIVEIKINIEKKK